MAATIAFGREGRRCAGAIHIGEYDGIWHGDKLDDAKGFFLKAPFADVYQQRQSGHDVELEHLGFAQALKVVAFAEECRLRLSKMET